MIYKVKKEQLLEHLPLIEGYIKQALEKDDNKYSFWDIARVIGAGEADLFVFVDKKIIGCGVLKKESYPTKDVCLVFLTAGEKMELWLDEWVHCIKLYSRENNCSYIEWVGRKGWLKVLKGIAKIQAIQYRMEN